LVQDFQMNATITEHQLIASLIKHPRNDFETGFNSALISLLQQLNGIAPEVNETNNQSPQLNRLDQILRDSLTESEFNSLYAQKREEIYSLVQSGAKLAAVKTLKGYTGIGLKEAKDICDLVQEELSRNGDIF